MQVIIHLHARQRLMERGASEDEVVETVLTGEMFPAKFERTAFRKNFSYQSIWNSRNYQTKQIETYCVKENNDWIVITVIVKYF